MITIAYLTNREVCQFNWFADSLKNQSKKIGFDNFEVVVVDGYKGERAVYDEFISADTSFIKNNLWYTHPKPTVYQGKFRLTSKDYFCAANARNTAVLYALGDYIVFVDDLSVLCEDWLETVVKCYEANTVCAGAYKKAWEMQVENGEIVNMRIEQSGIDSRLIQSESTRRINGTQLFGCSFGLPLELYLDLNGQDEMCDSIGGEDYNFGIRLERYGVDITYYPKMLTIESEELHGQGTPALRLDKKLTEPLYRQKMMEYGITRRWYESGNYDSSHQPVKH